MRTKEKNQSSSSGQDEEKDQKKDGSEKGNTGRTLIPSFTANLPPTILAILTLTILAFLHFSALYVFSQGFLLSRLTLPDRASCSPSSPHPCLIEPSHSKAIILLIDALRYDFILPHNSTIPSDPYCHNQLVLPAQLTATRPAHSRLFHFQADPPTTTLQRLKGLTTGTLPTFIDIGSNFASSNVAIDEDNWLAQLHAAGKTIGFTGDDTWLNLFGIASPDRPGHSGGIFHPNLTFPYESFNVEDLDTVDTGVEKNMLRILGIDNTDQPHGQQHWDVLIGHMLGLDHAGHRFGASHPTVAEKLRQYNRFLEKIVASLDHDTLLIVMGDHGMDPKGDHGGDSFPEVSSGLWLYSKTRPLVSERVPLPDWALAESDFIALEPSLGTVRTVAQIDLVPTLALMLGVPIPFSSLGMLIPEIFFRSTLAIPAAPTRTRKPDVLSEAETLLMATTINSDQLKSFLERSSARSPGQDLAQHLPKLRAHYTAALEHSQHQHPAQAFRTHRFFGAALLETSRRIWAKFVATLMAIGILILILALGVSWKLVYCLRWTTDGSRAPVRSMLAAGLSCGLLGGALGLASHSIQLMPDAGLLTSLLAGSALAICFAMLACPTPASPIWRPLVKPTTIVKLVPLALHALAFASNSFTIWEDKAVVFLALSALLPVVIRGFGAPQQRLRNRLVLFSVLFFVCVRLIGMSTVCREEQHGECSVTFYASATSSGAPGWAMGLLIPLALVLPIGLAWFMGQSDSYRGAASMYFGSGLRISLLCAVQYWITDHIISQGDLSVDPSLKTTGSWIKTMAARVDVGLLLVGIALWLVLPLCIDVEHQEGTPGGKPRVLVLGFANAYGSTYLMFVAAGFGALFLTSQPVGELTLALGLIAALALVEINDTLRDIQALEGAVAAAVGAAAGNAPALDTSAAKVPGTDMAIICALSLLGHVLFFGTGHQATFASIQWKTAFIGLRAADRVWSGLLVGLNTFGGFALTALVAPLFAVWNVSPVLGKGGSVGLTTGVLEAAVAAGAVQTVLAGSAMVCCSVLRRHLMVWKIFAPRFMVAGVAMIVGDVVGVLAVGVGAGVAGWKVRRAFGTRTV